MSVALPGPYRSTTTRTGGRSHNRGLGSLKRSSFQPGYVVPILVGGGDIHVAVTSMWLPLAGHLVAVPAWRPARPRSSATCQPES